MNKTEHLLVCLGEECGEVQQSVAKCLRFGLEDLGPSSFDVNMDIVVKEVHDLFAVYIMLCGELEICSDIDYNMVQCKITKLNKWMEYSREKGVLDYETN